MTSLSPNDKINLATFLESSVISLSALHTSLPLIKDDGLRKLAEAAIGAGEAQIKAVQEFCQSHNLS